ncbi:CBS domain-containing protein [Pseudenhygromyxa sp. WMMC2535]|uniref:glutamate-cysteine ligase family protein n=1 Tax=Pseudenhygromyxa sp. WMMC2535 TaxID=2712867 RepID=UPI00155808F9|nr:glutamate-cysteine ligase family protein [Pseudenhygromyxa sp. WMMC2535]NVB41587.1 CBS domain-containing protein [Pseudenhygromyxa sp. WMMC2535]
MGEHQVSDEVDDAELRAFMRAILADVHALEELIDKGMIESGIRRIGAEQEMFLVDETLSAAPVATQVLEAADDPRLTTELAKFNLEANLSPQDFGGDCLRKLEDEIEEVLGIAREAAQRNGAKVVLSGILPTLRKPDLTMDNMTPFPRYFALNKAMQRMRGGQAFQVTIKGKDELELAHENVMLEAANTSFQIHFQSSAEEFARLYNLAQAVTAPVLAVAVNSPVLMGKRLWNETRVALFHHSVDTRNEAHKARGGRPRVSFGDRWVDDSVLEIFREDIARFRVVLSTALDGEDPLEALRAGRVPELKALRLHNGTVYRWNRACYGVVDNVPHLRIENRALPAGPSVLDEVANAALYFGLLSGLGEQVPDLRKVMEFDDARHNFFSAARYGLDARLTWIGGRTYEVSDLLQQALIPLAREGLERHSIASDDIDRYLGVLSDRVDRMVTGASWAMTSLAAMPAVGPRDARSRALVNAMVEHQRANEPIHSWQPAAFEKVSDVRDNYLTVGQFMTTDLLTVHPEDLVDLAASLMDWERIRHVPVEEDGRLVGLISHRAVLRLVARGHLDRARSEKVAVREIMRPDPITVAPETTTLEVLRIMRDYNIGALPVVDGDTLAGIVTERDLIEVSSKLLEDYLRGP